MTRTCYYSKPHLTIISTTQTGEQGNSGSPTFSASGRYVTFDSYSSNLAHNDKNDIANVFIKDLKTGELRLISTNAEGELGNRDSHNFGVSANGHYVVFSSSANNFVDGDNNGVRDIFVKDTKTGEVTLASSDAEGHAGQGGESFGASISASGRYVAFNSQAKNLVDGPINQINNVFVKDLKTGDVALASSDANGNPGIGAGDLYAGASSGASISGNGRYVGFTSGAENFVSADINDETDVFVKNLKTGELVLASIDSQGNQGNDWSGDSALSADGRYVVFRSWASNFVLEDNNQNSDVFVKDLCTGKLTIVSVNKEGHVGDGQSLGPSISPNGRYVAFASNAENLVSGDTNGVFDVFVKDMHNGSLKLISIGPDGVPADFQSVNPQVNDNGNVVFASGATNLVEHDANSVPGSSYDIFLWA